MEVIFIQLAVILLVAFVVSYVARALKQPIIIAYIVSGMLISPFIFRLGASAEIIDTLSQFGIAFLLFIVGLHLNPKVIKEIGTSSLLIGLAQIALTFGVGYLASIWILKFNVVTSLYVGIAIAFSSTIIIMKLLSDKGNLDSLYGKISIGILIIQDLVAVGVLMFISSLTEGTSFGSFALKGLLLGGGSIVVLFLAGFYVLPKLVKNIAKNQELLFLFSIFWAFAVAALFGYFGFSIEIGALVAGMVLSISPYSVEISSKVRPLRDFFIIIFFIILGLNIEVSNLASVLKNAVILSAIVLVFKPIILMFFSAMFRYTKRTNFLVGSTLAQISEFSLIVLALGVSLGHINSDILHTLTLTLVITIIFSTYMTLYSEKIYRGLFGFVSIFERKSVRKERNVKGKYDAILFGYNRIGFGILKSLKKIKKNYLVVDYNPDTISTLSKFEIPCLYGDIGDVELLSELPLDKLKIAVSTVPDFETNQLLIQEIRNANPHAIIIVRAHKIREALELYSRGASYVLTPHFLGGEYVSNMLKDFKTDSKGYKQEKAKHINLLREISSKGDDHPDVNKN